MWRDSSHQKLSLLSSPSLWISLKKYDKPLKYSTSFQTPGYAEHCSQSSRCLQDVRRSSGMGSQRKGKRWLRKELSCVLIQCGCHSKSEEMRAFLLEANPRYCFTQCTQRGGAHPFNSVIFLCTLLLLGALSLNLLFLFFFIWFIWWERNVLASSSAGLISCRSA